MRVMYIHAGKRINKDLKDDEFHVNLFRDRLRLRFDVPTNRNCKQNLSIDSQSSLEIIERLPRGQILGVAIFDATYWFNKSQHFSDPWSLGPFCYHILDVFRFERGVDASGQLGIWTPTEHAQNEILSQITVKNKLNEWRHRYGARLSFGKDPNGTPSAITILQPFVEAILRGEKCVENRKRPFFRLHDDKSLYNHPIAPKPTECRFCPDDGSPCSYWFHLKDKPRSKVTLSQTDSDDDDVDMSETEEDYSSNEEEMFKSVYNTRSRKKSYEALMANLINTDFIMENTNNNVMKNRKRKRNEMNGNQTQSRPSKKQKKEKKSKKKKKKHRKWREKWEKCKTELKIGEDGISPLRLCWHGRVMSPEVNPLSDPKDCHLCGEMISWDQYYHCDCNGIRTNLCYHHARGITLPAANGWKRVSGLLSQYDERERLLMIDGLRTPQSYIKKKKKKKRKKNAVGVDINVIREEESKEDIYRLCFDPNKMNFKIKSEGVSAPPQQPDINTLSSAPFKRLPFKLNLDPAAIQHSINVVQHKKEENGGFMTNGMLMDHNKMDFSQFPSNITPTMSEQRHTSSITFNIDNIPINNHIPINNPIPSKGLLTLSQILGNSAANNKKVTPVPSPFAPSPSPTNKNDNSNNMRNVYALQSLLNSNNHNDNNINVNNINLASNPFGPNPINPNTNNNDNTNTENTSSSGSTSSNSLTNKSNAQPSYYGVIPPSYQSMHPAAMPTMPYVQLPVQATNGHSQMVYMMPQQVPYYALPYNPYQYNQQQNKPSMPVPVQQT